MVVDGKTLDMLGSDGVEFAHLVEHEKPDEQRVNGY